MEEPRTCEVLGLITGLKRERKEKKEGKDERKEGKVGWSIAKGRGQNQVNTNYS